MPAGNRIRANNVYGVITDNPLTIGATTFNSTGLANLPVVASAHAVITLDPLRQFGEPEIVVVTAHTASATVATITRGQYGTAARSHPQGTVWVHAPIDEDVIEVLTSSTRPSNPYEGQFIFETDTNKLVGYGGVDWAPRDAGGTLGYAQVVASQGGIVGTQVDLTGLSSAVTVGSGRRVRISAQIPAQSTVDNDYVRLDILEGAAFQNLGQRRISTSSTILKADAVITPSAGAHTYKLQLGRTVGTGTITMTAAASSPAFILVEDIGAA